MKKLWYKLNKDPFKIKLSVQGIRKQYGNDSGGKDFT